MFTDTHCHILSEYYSDIELVIKNAKKNNVGRFINSGSDAVSNKENIKLIQNYSEIYATLGLHPHEALKYEEKDLNFIENNLSNDKVVAIGEIGLDYYYGKDSKIEQQELFEKQLSLASKYNYPVVIHSRDAVADTIACLKRYNLKGVIHSFSGSYETALEYIKMGYLLGINGVVTFKNSKLKEVVAKIPLENIVLETDCPYLTPEPFRGTQNEPKNILEIANYICEIRKISLEELAEKTNKNIARIFDI